MPMQCSRCNTIAERGNECPNCGGPMRLSLLAGAVSQEKGAEEEAALVARPISTGERISQWFNGVLVSHCCGVLMVASVYGAFVASGMKLEELPEKNALAASVTTVAVALFSVAITMATFCRGIYLGQLVGLAVGATVGPAFGAEKLAYGLAVPWYEWAALVFFTPIVGFLVGMRSAGGPPTVQKKAAKGVNDWKDDEQPIGVEIRPYDYVRWYRMFGGAVFGFFWIFFLRWALLKVFGGTLDLYHDSLIQRFFSVQGDRVAMLIIVAASGFFAGARTQSGFTQGLYSGLLILGIGYLFRKMIGVPIPDDQLSELAILAVTAAPIAGVLGRYIMKPSRVFREQVKP